ncbi:MAG: DUF2164 domain-containing protein [Candidatus Marinimicrobia bacterium]|nr:DUF2164 domain-containing protein [Candidatus Neomarinimicrobiota bacterium]MCF7850808.1 DUF2164 domain-containing protein [Candidatus Neomarinimicrobiota bacterium]MCF7905048.1 DUF2164 domain-containing protein [Candidatus Neomarinimicrobiota bacterium]
MSQMFSRELKDLMIDKIKAYTQTELDHELGNFEAEFLIDFITETFGPLYYNQAIQDVQVHLSAALDSMGERMVELEKPIPFQV